MRVTINMRVNGEQRSPLTIEGTAEECLAFVRGAGVLQAVGAQTRASVQAAIVDAMNAAGRNGYRVSQPG